MQWVSMEPLGWDYVVFGIIAVVLFLIAQVSSIGKQKKMLFREYLPISCGNASEFHDL